MRKLLRDNNLQLTRLQFYTNNITRCLGILDLLSERKEDHQFNAHTSVLLSYKSIIYKSSILWYFPITSEHSTSQQHRKVSRYSESFICKETRLIAPKSIIRQHTARYIDIANLLSARRQYLQCNTFTSVLLSDKSIIKSPNKPLIFYQFQSNILKMFTLYSDKLQLIFDAFYSKHEATDPPYNQISEQKLLIDSLAIELKEFQEKWYQRREQ